MINGEPTENKLALASKGALHVELVARGKMAHSAYPELGESAIDKLVEALHRLHAMKLPQDAEVGPCTKNVGAIQGGRAPNVISDFAKADLFYRLVGPTEDITPRDYARPSAISPRSASPARLRSCGCAQWRACRRWLRLSGPTFRRLQIGASRCCWGRVRFTWRTPRASLWRRRSYWTRWRFIVRWRNNLALSPGAIWVVDSLRFSAVRQELAKCRDRRKPRPSEAKTGVPHAQSFNAILVVGSLLDQVLDDVVRFVDVAESAIAQTAHGWIVFFAGDIIVRLVEQFQSTVIAAAVSHVCIDRRMVIQILAIVNGSVLDFSDGFVDLGDGVVFFPIHAAGRSQAFQMSARMAQVGERVQVCRMPARFIGEG